MRNICCVGPDANAAAFLVVRYERISSALVSVHGYVSRRSGRTAPMQRRLVGTRRAQLGLYIRTFTAASSTANEHAISAAPPPYTMRLSRTRLRTTQSASCSERSA